MREDVFAEFTFGILALEKIAPEDPNFRLYVAGFMGAPNEHEVMKVSGAVFREPLRGPNKGMLSIRVPKTSRTVYVRLGEIETFARATAISSQPEQCGVARTMGFESLLRTLEAELGE